MGDNKDNRGTPDNKRVNIHEPYEVNTVKKRDHVTKKEVEDAVKNVGTSTKKVDDYLKNKKNK